MRREMQVLEIDVTGGNANDAVRAILLGITNRHFEPTDLRLAADDDRFADFVAARHRETLAEKGEMEVDGFVRAELERVENLDASIRAVLEDVAAPLRQLALADV